MKNILIILAMLFTFTLNAQVTRPRSAQVINFGDSISYYVQNQTILANENLLPAYVPRMTDTVFAPYNAPHDDLTALLGDPWENRGTTRQIYDASFSTFFAYSDGVNWIISAVAYNTITDYNIYFVDSVYNDWGADSYLAPDVNWPGDSLPSDIDTGSITIYVNNYTEGISVPITIFDIFTPTSCECVSGLSPGWITIDGEAPFWYDWQRSLSNDTVIFNYTVDKTKIDFGDSTRVIGRLEFSYPTAGPGQQVNEPYPGKSYAIKIMKDTPE